MSDATVAQWTFSQALVHYTLFASMMALGASFVFFLAERDKILPEYQGTMTTTAMIVGVAAVAYYFLTREYAPGQPFPTDVRYVDWTITTPLLLLKYPEMLKVRGFAFGWKLVLADLFMIVTGFIGELYGHTVDGRWTPTHDIPNAVTLHYVWGTISTVGYLVILYLLLSEGGRLARTAPPAIQRGVTVMNRYLWTLWGVYPIVYILEAVSTNNPNVNLDWAQIVSAVADVINKVGFGLTAYFAVKAVSGGSQYSQERVPEPAAAGAGR